MHEVENMVHVTFMKYASISVRDLGGAFRSLGQDFTVQEIWKLKEKGRSSSGDNIKLTDFERVVNNKMEEAEYQGKEPLERTLRRADQDEDEEEKEHEDEEENEDEEKDEEEEVPAWAKKIMANVDHLNTELQDLMKHRAEHGEEMLKHEEKTSDHHNFEGTTEKGDENSEYQDFEEPKRRKKKKKK